MAHALYTHEAQDAQNYERKASVDVDRLCNNNIREAIDLNSKYLDVGLDAQHKPVRIRYCVLGGTTPPLGSNREESATGGPGQRPRMVLIMGLAASLDAWKPQILDMLHPEGGATHAPMEMCLLDNRGVGRSSVPERREDYSTAIMAHDVAAVLDHIGWPRAHVVGFSMGGMVATKFAALWPHRVLSLAVISCTAGGWHTIPRSWKAWKYVLQLQRDKTPATRARVDLKFHFTKQTLRKFMPPFGRTRRELLHREYMGSPSPSMERSLPRSLSESSAPPPAAAPSASAGLRGQMHACWTHTVPPRDAERIRKGGFPRLCVHGRQDIVAEARFGEALAARLEATMVMMEGAHFIPRERGHEVSLLLEGLVLGQPRQRERQHLDPERHLLPEGVAVGPLDAAPSTILAGASLRRAGSFDAVAIAMTRRASSGKGDM